MKLSFTKNLIVAVTALEAALVSLHPAPAGAEMLMSQTLAEFLDDLVSLGDLTRRQKAAILGLSDRQDAGYRNEYFSPSARGTLRGYLMGNVGQGRIDQYTAEIIASTLSLGGLYPSEEEEAATAESAIQGAVQAVYDPATTEGNMVRLGRSGTLTAVPGDHYNGIWGYAKDDKEYALQCHGEGLLIIDVTDPTNPVRVQLIPMGGGGVWRDVATNGDYAYVAAQGTNGGGQPDAYAINLSYLSGDANKAYTVDESPIPSSPAGINNFGATDYGHTLNAAKGLLFLNTASSRRNRGCRVYDVTTNPMNPRYLFSSGGSGRACHDSSVFENVDGQDLWIVSEGGGQQDRIYDITNVDSSTTNFKSIPFLGSTPTISGTYAHSNWLSEDGRFLFSCEENNNRDIIVHDVTDKRNLVRIAEFQFSEQSSFNSAVHNGEIRGEYYFVSYYSGGMRTFDISNPYWPVEVGKVESYRDPNGDGVYENPNGDSGTGPGGWNGYPYLPSGNILLSDRYGGTFIVKANPPYDAPAAPNSATAIVLKDEGTGDVSLSWNAVNNARGYNILRSSTVGGPYSVVAEFLVSTTFTDTSIGVEDAYYKIKVFNGEGEAESNVLPALVDSTTNSPSAAPTKAPTPPTNPPSRAPTGSPSAGPSKAPTRPSNAPSRAPTHSPTTAPSKAPTPPTSPPSRAPTGSPSTGPSNAPTPPTNPPSLAPTGSPSTAPSKAPTPPSNSPSSAPTRSPTTSPTGSPFDCSITFTKKNPCDNDSRCRWDRPTRKCVGAN